MELYLHSLTRLHDRDNLPLLYLYALHGNLFDMKLLDLNGLCGSCHVPYILSKFAAEWWRKAAL